MFKTFKELLRYKYNKNFWNIQIFSNFFWNIFYMLFKKLFQYKYNKNILYIQTFLKKFSNKTIVLVRWREPGIAAALGSGEHAVHLLCRSTSIIPIRIVAIYMTDTSLLYPYSLLNQNQTDPINIFSFLWIWRESNPRL